MLAGEVAVRAEVNPMEPAMVLGNDVFGDLIAKWVASEISDL